jgi:DNA-binding response OmpR family regulator
VGRAAPNAAAPAAVQPPIVPAIRFVDGQTFHPDSGEVHRDDRVRRLEPQPAALLALLAGRAGAVVTHAVVEKRPNDHHARMVALLTTLHDLVY